jgi:serine/threonine protein kinase
VQSFGWYESLDAVYITMEFFEHGDLQQYLDKLPTGVTIPEKEVQLVAYQILEGLRIMHENGFAHRDLKPANILIRRTGDHEKGWWVKIGDFGISKRAENDVTAFRTISGTAGFLAPEILAQSGLIDNKFLGGKCEYTVSVDIWSMGEIIYRVATRVSPFVKGLGAYIRGTESFPTQLLKKHLVSDSGVDLIEKLMKLMPDERLTAAQALKHPWFKAFFEEQDLPRSSAEFVK